RPRDEHEVVAEDAGERVVVDARLEGRIGVQDLTAGAAVGPDVRGQRRDVLLAAIQLDALDAVAADEGGHPVTPPSLRPRARRVPPASPRSGGRTGRGAL